MQVGTSVAQRAEMSRLCEAGGFREGVRDVASPGECSMASFGKYARAIIQATRKASQDR